MIVGFRAGSAQRGLVCRILRCRTGRKRAETKNVRPMKHVREMSQASDVDYRLILDSIPGMVCALTPLWEIEFVNQQLQDYFGKSARELESWTTNGTVHADDLRQAILNSERAVASGEPFVVEQRYLRHDGEFRWFELRATPQKGPQGHIVRWLLLLADIEDRKRAEQALAARERSLDLIINTMPVLTWSARGDGTTDFFNDHYLQYTGLNQQGAEGWGWTDIFHPEDTPRLASYWRALIQAGSAGEFEARMRRYDGVYRWFLIRANPLRDEAGVIVRWYGTNTDINDRKQAEEALSRATHELARVTRATSLDVLTASIAHEVNQPLSGILTNAGTCLRMLDAPSPNIEGALETARRTIRDANRAAEVITKLRTLFSGKGIASETLDLNAVVREVIAMYSSEMQRDHIVSDQELDGMLPAISGDRVQLQQVILNLLRNASDAIKEGPGEERRIWIRTSLSGGGRIRFAVKDTGVSFDPALQDCLFEAFHTTKTDGMGIGLSVSRSIIAAHGGSIYGERNNGPGSTFYFELPSARGLS